jgi:hypothetical protein
VEKTFLMNSPTSTSYERSVDIFRPFLTVFEFLRIFGSAAKEAPPSGQNTVNEKPDPDFLLVVCSAA